MLVFIEYLTLGVVGSGFRADCQNGRNGRVFRTANVGNRHEIGRGMCGFFNGMRKTGGFLAQKRVFWRGKLCISLRKEENFLPQRRNFLAAKRKICLSTAGKRAAFRRFRFYFERFSVQGRADRLLRGSGAGLSGEGAAGARERGGRRRMTGKRGVRLSFCFPGISRESRVSVRVRQRTETRDSQRGKYCHSGRAEGCPPSSSAKRFLAASSPIWAAFRRLASPSSRCFALIWQRPIRR